MRLQLTLAAGDYDFLRPLAAFSKSTMAAHCDITWFVEREDAVHFTPLDGRLDELLSPDLPLSSARAIHASRGCSPPTRRKEVAYYKKTGIFPVMHLRLIKREIVERYP